MLHNLAQSETQLSHFFPQLKFIFCFNPWHYISHAQDVGRWQRSYVTEKMWPDSPRVSDIPETPSQHWNPAKQTMIWN